MNDSIREQLSAMADGELEGEGTRFLLKRLERDAEFRGVWERYHLMRDCLRHQGGMAPVDFCGNVSALIDADDALLRRKPAPRHVWQGLAGGAIAAGVAAIALFALRIGPAEQGLQNGLADVNLEQVAPMTTSDLVPAWRVAPVAERERFVLVPQPMASELDAYFLRHGEAAGDVGLLGPLPAIQTVASSPIDAAQGE